MSRIDELIAELCPNGVEYKQLGDCCLFYNGDRGKNYPYHADYCDTGVPFINAGDLENGIVNLLNCNNISEEKYNSMGGAKLQYGDVIYCLRGSIGKNGIFLSDRGALASSLVAIRPNKTILGKYVYYLLNSSMELKQRTVKDNGAAQPNLSAHSVKKYIFPIPPLEVQCEIVKILDNFTELTAELTARKKQYEYYRDLLLDFGVHSGATSECEWRTLGDVIVSLNTGLNPRKFFKLNTDDAENYYITIREIRNGKIIPTDKTDRLNDEALCLCNNRSNLEVGDVLFSGTGTIGETAVITEKPTNWNIKEGVYTIKPIQSIILPFFLHYLLQTESIKIAYMKKVAGGTVKSIPMAEMKKLMIPIPSIEEQKRIVSILDRFDKLCNDISEGLPAGIEARRKQYEYYRDKLLTFKLKE